MRCSACNKKLGKCMFCIAIAILGTVIGWALFFYFSFIFWERYLATVAFWVALFFTILLLAHVIASLIREQTQYDYEQKSTKSLKSNL